jgi:hypothetical protein
MASCEQLNETTRRADGIPSENPCEPLQRCSAGEKARASSVNGVSLTVEPVTALKKQPFPDGH